MKLPQNIHALALLSVMAAALLSAGCTEKNNSANPLLPFLLQPCPAINVPAGTTMLECGSAVNDNKTYYYYLLKLEYDGHEPSYAMWIPPEEGRVKPVVVMTNPYDAIRWNGDNPPPGTSEYPYQTYVDNAAIFLFNGFGALHVFGRFYTGGNLQNDVDDMTAGLRFLADSGFADTARIGIWGGSWGGFEALYGAANAPGGAVPAAGVAFFPPVDFNAFEHYVTEDIPAMITDETKKNQYSSFFSPYLDRIHGTTGWNTWTTAALAAKLTTPFLLLHDEWDTLVPVSHSGDLVAIAGGMVEPVWFYHETALDLNDLYYGWGHGELRQYQFDDDPPPAFTYGICNTLATAYIIIKLADAGQQVFLAYDVDALDDYIAYIRDYTCNHGRDTSWAADRLLDLADDRVVVVDVNSGNWAMGPDAVAKAFSDAGWGGTDYGTAASIRTALGRGLPACPKVSAGLMCTMP